MIGPYCRLCGEGAVILNMDEEICGNCWIWRNFQEADLSGGMYYGHEGQTGSGPLYYG